MPNDVKMRCTSLVRLQNSITKSLRVISNIQLVLNIRLASSARLPHFYWL